MYFNSFKKQFTASLLGKAVLLISILAFMCATFSTALAQHKNFFISKKEPSWIVKKDLKGDQPKLKDITDGYYYSLLETQNHAELQEEYKHVIKQVISDAGVQNASEITVTFDPTFQKLTFHKIVVWRKNVATDKLYAAGFKILQNEKDLSKFIYSGTFDAYLVLDDIRKGDRIEYTYTIKGNNPVYGDKISLRYYLENSSKIGQIYDNLIVDPKRNLHYKNFNYNTPPKISSHGILKLYEWENKRTNIYESLDFEPSWYDPFKNVQITEYNNWNEVVNWGLKVNSYPDLKTPLIKETAKELLIKAKHQPTRYIELATRFVQNEIRYMGIEMGEYSQRPNSPEKVLKQRYGDCKDKSLLLIHLLAKAKIKAYMAYVDTYIGQKLSSYLPSPFLFNHAVIEYKNKKIWIDPTISDQRGSYDHIYFPNYGQALVLKAGVNQLENIVSKATGKLKADLVFTIVDTASSNGKDTTSNTPISNAANTHVSNAAPVVTSSGADDTNTVSHSKETRTSSAAKVSTLVIKSVYTDDYADNMRSSVAKDGISSLQKSFLDYIKRYYPDAELNEDLTVQDNEDDNRVEFTESYTLNNLWVKEDDNKPGIYAYFYGDLILNTLRKVTLKNRTEPLTLKYPANIEQNISVELPFDLNTEEDSERVDNDFYNFSFNSSQQGNKFNLSYTFKALKEDIDGDQIDNYVRETKKLKETLSYSVSYGSTPATEEANDLNPYTILLFLVTAAISGYFFYQVYQWRYEFDIAEMANARPIRGWLVLVAIDVMLGPLSVLYVANKASMFSGNKWIFLEKLSTAAQVTAWSIITIQCITWSILFTWGILNMVSLAKRRDIFTQQYIRYMITACIFTFFNLIASIYVNSLTHNQLVTAKEMFNFIFGIGIMTIWIFYMRRSERVRETFVFSYPSASWKSDLKTHQLEQHKTTIDS
jgi:hypothetical protein